MELAWRKHSTKNGGGLIRTLLFGFLGVVSCLWLVSDVWSEQATSSTMNSSTRRRELQSQEGSMNESLTTKVIPAIMLSIASLIILCSLVLYISDIVDRFRHEKRQQQENSKVNSRDTSAMSSEEYRNKPWVRSPRGHDVSPRVSHDSAMEIALAHPDQDCISRVSTMTTSVVEGVAFFGENLGADTRMPTAATFLSPVVVAKFTDDYRAHKSGLSALIYSSDDENSTSLLASESELLSNSKSQDSEEVDKGIGLSSGCSTLTGSSVSTSENMSDEVSTASQEISSKHEMPSTLDNCSEVPCDDGDTVNLHEKCSESLDVPGEGDGHGQKNSTTERDHSMDIETKLDLPTGTDLTFPSSQETIHLNQEGSKIEAEAQSSAINTNSVDTNHSSNRGKTIIQDKNQGPTIPDVSAAADLVLITQSDKMEKGQLSHSGINEYIRDIYFVATVSTLQVQSLESILGIELANASSNDTHPSVIKVDPSGPLAGRIFKGDFILSINEIQTRGMTNDATLQLIQTEEQVPKLVKMIKLTVVSSEADMGFEDCDVSVEDSQGGLN